MLRESKVKAFRLCVVIVATAATTSAYGQTSRQPPRPAPQAQRPAAQQQPNAEPVSRTLFIQTMDAVFKRMDADKNNVLTRKEIEDYLRAGAVAVARQRNAAMFQAMDKDKNGSLSAGEFADLPMSVPQPDAAPVLAQTDGNRDGSVTLVEYRTGKLVNFDRMDADKDGIVSVAEMRAGGLAR